MASMADHVRAMLAFQASGSVVFDYGNNIRAHAREAGVENAFDFPGFVPAFIRPLFCEGKGPFRWAALSGDPEDILQDRCGPGRALPGGRQPAPMAAPGRGEGAVPGPAGPDLLAGLRGAGAGRAADQRDGGVGRAVRADRDRARPPGRRLRRQPVPRDGGHARRVRCDRRLADPERAAQHSRRRHLGELPPRRRRRHRLFTACRHGGRRRWHRRRPPRAWSGC